VNPCCPRSRRTCQFKSAAMKKDIQNRKDIELLVNRFYQKVISDEMIGHIFTEVAKLNWEKHLPVVYDFWENSLFYTGAYNGNPMEMHKRLNRVIPLTPGHFDRWNQLFFSTVDELFAGEKAALAKQRAFSISTVMQIKLSEEQTDNNKIY
jgi:hemoglobin